MPLRSVMMKRFIFGFQRRVWCPKWTPLSSSWRMVTTAMRFSCCGGARAPVCPTLRPGRAGSAAPVVFSCRTRRVPAALTLTRDPIRPGRAGRDRGSAPAGDRAQRSRPVAVCERAKSIPGWTAPTMVVHASPPCQSLGAAPRSVHSAGRATLIHRRTTAGPHLDRIGRTIGGCACLVRSLAALLLVVAPATLPVPTATADAEPVGVWPLVPEPDVVRPFEAPPAPWGPGTGASTWPDVPGRSSTPPWAGPSASSARSAASRW